MKSIISIPILYKNAIISILTNKKYFFLAITPFITGVISFFLIIYFGYPLKHLLFDYLSTKVLFEPGIIQTIFSFLINFVSLILFVISSSIASILIVAVVSGYFLELLIEFRLKEKKIYDLPDRSIIQLTLSVLRGIKEDIKRIIFLIILLVLSLTLGFIPLLNFIPLLIGFFLISFDLFDLPHVLLEVPFKKRLSYSKKNMLFYIVNGLIGSFFLAIPIVNSLFLPIGYIVAVDQLSSDLC